MRLIVRQSFSLILSALLISACSLQSPSEMTAKNEQPQNFSILALYGRNGINDLTCKITLTKGRHIFSGPASYCKNDHAYYFIVENPREGLKFEIWKDSVLNHTNCHTPSAMYSIVDPIPGQPTQMLPVGAALNIPSGKEIVPGVISGGTAQSSGFPIAGQVSCVTVEDSGH